MLLPLPRALVPWHLALLLMCMLWITTSLLALYRFGWQGWSPRVLGYVVLAVVPVLLVSVLWGWEEGLMPLCGRERWELAPNRFRVAGSWLRRFHLAPGERLAIERSEDGDTGVTLLRLKTDRKTLGLAAARDEAALSVRSVSRQSATGSCGGLVRDRGRWRRRGSPRFATKCDGQ